MNPEAHADDAESARTHGEHSERIANIERQLAAHVAADERAFASIDGKLDSLLKHKTQIRVAVWLLVGMITFIGGASMLGGARWVLEHELDDWAHSRKLPITTGDAP